MPKPVTRKKDTAPERSVLYPDLSSTLCQGDDALTSDFAKQLLGWEEMSDSTNYMLKDVKGTPIRCVNNNRNRPFDAGRSEQYRQDILNKRWRLTHQGIGIGRTGMITDGQHRLVALVLAEQTWADRQTGDHYDTIWGDKPPTIETFVTFGVLEDKETLRCMDNVKPRSFADVLFSDGRYFGKSPVKDRQALCRMTETALKMLWYRTGANRNSFTSKRTHSEALDWLDRHERLIRCVKHIHEEYSRILVVDDKKILQWPILAKRMSPGFASALLYLMAASATDPAKYRAVTPPSEKRINWDNWDKAMEFWVLFASSAPLVYPLIEAIGNLLDPESSDGRPGTFSARSTLFFKAWCLYLAETEMTKKSLKLDWKKDKNEIWYLPTSELVSAGGIDYGDPALDEDGDEEEADDPTPEEIKEKAAEVKPKPAPKPVKKPTSNGAPDAEFDADLLKKREEQKAKLLASRKKDKATEGLTDAGRKAQANDKDECDEAKDKVHQWSEPSNGSKTCLACNKQLKM